MSSFTHIFLAKAAVRKCSRTLQPWNEAWLLTGQEGVRVDVRVGEGMEGGQDLIFWNWVNVLWSVPCTTHVHCNAKFAQDPCRNVVLGMGSGKELRQEGDKRRKDPPSWNSVCHIETVTAVSLIQGGKKTNIAVVYDFDLNVNGFLKDLCWKCFLSAPCVHSFWGYFSPMLSQWKWKEKCVWIGRLMPFHQLCSHILGWLFCVTWHPDVV